MSCRSIPVPVWIVIDGVLDNVAAVERVGGDFAVEAHAMALREAGWVAMRQHPDIDPELGWPPADAELRIELSTADEHFIRKALDDSQRVALEILAESDLHPVVRQKQEEDLAAGDAAIQFWRALPSL